MTTPPCQPDIDEADIETLRFAAEQNGWDTFVAVLNRLERAENRRDQLLTACLAARNELLQQRAFIPSGINARIVTFSDDAVEFLDNAIGDQ